MIIKKSEFKKKWIKTSCLLVLIGAVIVTIGFAVNGFDVDSIYQKGPHKWYNTLYIGDEGFGFGVHGFGVGYFGYY